MIVYALSDPHLSRVVDKPMDLFGRKWAGHPEKMYEAWRSVVTPQDLVLVPGDISWAMRLPEARPDLEELDALPGFKLLTKGNHDYWWPGKRDFTIPGLTSLRFVRGRAFRLGPLGVAGTRGWKIPGDTWFTEQDQKIYDKEVRFLAQSLPALGDASIRMCMLHYPPFNDQKSPGAFVELLEAHRVRHVVFGHLHDVDPDRATIIGERNGVCYHLTSCDQVDFAPVPILEVDGNFDFAQAEVSFVPAIGLD